MPALNSTFDNFLVIFKSNTYETLRLLLKFIGEQDSRKNITISSKLKISLLSQSQEIDIFSSLIHFARDL